MGQMLLIRNIAQNDVMWSMKKQFISITSGRLIAAQERVNDAMENSFAYVNPLVL